MWIKLNDFFLGPPKQHQHIFEFMEVKMDISYAEIDVHANLFLFLF
jgi:hypothetical protein